MRCKHPFKKSISMVGTPNEVAAGMKGDDLGKTRELVKVRLWVRDLASPDLFPDDVRELSQEDIGGVQIEPIAHLASPAMFCRASSHSGSVTNHLMTTLASTVSFTDPDPRATA